MLCSLIISNVQVTRTLIDGGAGLNALSIETFNNLQVSYNQLQPTKPFSGVTDGSTVPIGQVRALELPAADPEEKKPKVNDVKRKGVAVLTAEPDTK